MKKTTISIIIGAVFVLAPITAQASVLDDLRAQISNLLQMIIGLQQQVNQLEYAESVVTPIGNTTQTNSSVVQDYNTNACLYISRDLWIGKRDSNTDGEVTKLQRFLIKEGVYPEAIVSGYYGNLTARAVVRWQKKNGMDFVTLKSGVGKMTRAKLSENCNNNAPYISTISKSQSYTLEQRGTLAKMSLEIRGSNFSGFEGDLFAWIENSSGEKGVLLGKHPDSTNQLLKLSLDHRVCKKVTWYSGLPCDDWLILVPGTYQIYIQTPNGRSNNIQFTVLQ